MTDATVTFDLFNALKVPFDARRTKVWVTFNTDDGWIVDENGDVRMDAGTATITDAGHVTIAGIPVPGVDTNPTDFQIKVHFDAPFVLPGVRGLQRKTGDFGWMTVTADADLTDLIAEQYVPPTWISEAIATLEAIIADANADFDDKLDQGQVLLDAQIALSGISTSDTAVAGLISNILLGPLTNAALSTAIAAQAALRLDNASTSTNGALTIEKLTKVDASGAARSMTIPDGTIKGQQVAVEKTDTSTNLVTVTGKIRSTGSSSVTLTYQYETLILIWGGTFWEPLAGHRSKTSIDTQAINRTTRPKHAPSLGLFFPEAEGALGDGTADDTAAIIAADTAAQANGAGIVYFDSNKTYRCNGRLARTFANPGTTPTSKPVQWTSGGASSASGQWVTNPLNGGATLDLRYDGTDGLGQAKIDTRGCGRLEIDHLNLISGGTDNFPFFQTTNTTVHAHHNFVRGNAANSQTTCQQDVFFLGGTDGTLGDHANAPFQGYGSKIHGNHFDRIRRGVVGRTYCNSVSVVDNVFSTKCGNDGVTGTATLGGAIEFIGTSGAGNCVGNVVRDNTIEVPYYKYAVAIDYASASILGPNGIWDAQSGGGTNHVAGYYIGTNALYNTVHDGQHNPLYPLVYDKGLTTTVYTSAQSRGAFFSQRAFFRGPVMAIPSSSGIGVRAYAAAGDFAYTKCSAGAAASPSYPEVILGTSPAQLVTDLATTSGSNIITSASAAFTRENEHMPINGTGIPSGTIVLRYISATSVEMSADATATATGITARIGFVPGGGTTTDEVGFARRHLITKGAIGSAAVAAPAGVGATVSAVGTDTAFVVTLTTGASSLSAGTLCTVNFGIAFTSSRAVPSLTPLNAAAAHAVATNEVYANISNTVFTIACGAGTPAASTAMIFAVHVIQS